MKKGEKKSKILALIIALIAVVTGSILFLSGLRSQIKSQPFTLSSEYYNEAKESIIDQNTLEKMLSESQSFILISYLPTCTNNIITFLKNYSDSHTISYFYINWSDFRETSLKNTVHFSPSVMLIKNGQVIDFLDANSNNYIAQYTNYTDFENWLNKYIIYEK